MTQPADNPSETLPDANAPRRRERCGVRFYAAIGSAAVALAVAIVVGVLMGAVYRNPIATDPQEGSGRFQEVRRDFLANPDDPAVVNRLREVDLEIRETYYRNMQLHQRGRWLLILLALVGVLSARLAVHFAKRKPDPKHDRRQPRITLPRGLAFAATGITLLALLATVGFAAVYYRTPLDALPVATGPDGGAKPAGPTWPSDEALKRNWPRFRGFAGMGVWEGGEIPLEFNLAEKHNIAWSVEVPLEGHSSPVVWGDRIFLTGATPEQREIYCYDAADGALLWRREVKLTPEIPAPRVHRGTGYAAPTGCTDGKRFFALFANGDLAAVDFSGEVLWTRNVGPLEINYGHSSSLTTWRNLLLLELDLGPGENTRPRLLALNVETGKPEWMIPRPEIVTWASPIVIRREAGDQLITVTNPYVFGNDPETGKELWRAKLLGGDVAPSPAWDGTHVYAAMDRHGLFAVDPGVEGEITEEQVAWKAEQGAGEVVSPLAADGYVYAADDGGKLICYRASDGEQLWRGGERGKYEASPTLVSGERIYWVNEKGVVYVYAAGEESKLLAENSMLAANYDELSRRDREGFHASPAFSPGRMFLRGTQRLYCIAATETQPAPTAETQPATRTAPAGGASPDESE